MKIFRFIGLFVLMAFQQPVFGQIRLEYTYDYSGTYTTLKYSGDKIFIMDVPASQCRIYNMDHSLWKTIHLAIPVNNYLYDVKYVSEGLFTDDERLALAYIYYSYNSATQVYSYNAKVITESGQELLSVPGCLYMYVYNMHDEGHKLLAYSYNFNVWPETVKTLVYSLPGQLATKAFSPDINPAKQSLAFPNPASSYTIIPYELPEGVGEGMITLTDMQGQVLRTFRVDRNFDHLRIDTSGLPAGVYLHTLIINKRVAGEGKVVIRR